MKKEEKEGRRGRREGTAGCREKELEEKEESEIKDHNLRKKITKTEGQFDVNLLDNNMKIRLQWSIILKKLKNV